MTQTKQTAISPTRNENYPEWYQQVIRAADLAENSPVRGCMIIKPWGYAIWELMQAALDKMFKDTGHKNAYFPLFIPISYLEKEAQHIKGFAKECAVVTHSRLEADKNGKLIPASPLEEPLIVRPTSETIIAEAYSKWIQSYRDLPILINQWANVVRWEMRTRLFLRTSEFLWQEGHTAHATKKEALEETHQMLRIYADFCTHFMAMPVIQGEKTESERFPGAVSTFAVEALMQDGKALQAGTSHFLGQNFSKASNIKFLDENSQEQFAWTTSWGSSTRLIGGLIMTHSDDDGLILPPKLAPAHVVILPVIPKENIRTQVLEYCNNLKKELENKHFSGAPIRVELDQRDIRGGEKMWQWVKKGVPIRLEIGPRDIAADSLFVARRDQPTSERNSEKRTEFLATVADQLQKIQANLLDKATQFRENNTTTINTKDDFYAHFQKDNTGFALAHWNGSPKVEEQIKKDLKVTIRCIPLQGEKEKSQCIITGEPSPQRVLFAKSYYNHNSFTFYNYAPIKPRRKSAKKWCPRRDLNPD